MSASLSLSNSMKSMTLPTKPCTNFGSVAGSVSRFNAKLKPLINSCIGIKLYIEASGNETQNAFSAMTLPDSKIGSFRCMIRIFPLSMSPTTFSSLISCGRLRKTNPYETQKLIVITKISKYCIYCIKYKHTSPACRRISASNH